MAAASTATDSTLMRFATIIDDITKGIQNGTKFYKMTIRGSGPNIVNIIDMRLGNVRPGGTEPAGMWVLRFDKAHGAAGTPSSNPHINVNYKLPHSRWTHDPHIQLSSSQLQAAESVAKFLKAANKVLLPLAVAIDVIRMIGAIIDDVSEGSIKNSAKTAASIAGGWGGGYLGATGGAAAGTAIFPGIGTVIGAVVGGILGSIIGSKTMEVLTEKAIDWWQKPTSSGSGSGIAEVNDNYGLQIDHVKPTDTERFYTSMKETPMFQASLALYPLTAGLPGLATILGAVLTGGLGPALGITTSMMAVEMLGNRRNYTFQPLNGAACVMTT